MMDKTQFDELLQTQHDIGVWSHENFGEQDPLNPLLGVAEEAGEFFESENLEDCWDAAADAMIFLMDFLERYNEVGERIYLVECVEEFERKGDWNIFKEVGVFNAIPIFTGRIYRSVLKLRQGIRKSENHKDKLVESIALLYFAYDRVVNYAYEGGEGYKSLYEAIISTWKRNVSKRDWTPETKVDNKEGNSNAGNES